MQSPSASLVHVGSIPELLMGLPDTLTTTTYEVRVLLKEIQDFDLQANLHMS